MRRFKTDHEGLRQRSELSEAANRLVPDPFGNEIRVRLRKLLSRPPSSKRLDNASSRAGDACLLPAGGLPKEYVKSLPERLCAAVSMSSDSEFPLRVTNDQRLAEEWELVLLAQGLAPSMSRNRDGVVISVPECEMDRARAALSAYEIENPPKVADEPVRFSDSFAGSTVAGLLILAFFSVTVLTNPAMSWFERGSADAQKILDGEFWRTVTALTLHADVAHALSNAVALALFLGAVSGVLGTGLGCAVILLAGAGGNLANALLHGSAHVSIGASTAVFGAVGVLGGLGVVMRRTRVLSRRRAWLPIAAALALLGMLGTGGARVDIWAHLLGLLVGGVLGVLVSIVVPSRPELRIQWACGGSAFALLVYAWTLALR